MLFYLLKDGNDTLIISSFYFWDDLFCLFNDTSVKAKKIWINLKVVKVAIGNGFHQISICVRGWFSFTNFLLSVS